MVVVVVVVSGGGTYDSSDPLYCVLSAQWFVPNAGAIGSVWVAPCFERLRLARCPLPRPHSHHPPVVWYLTPPRFSEYLGFWSCASTLLSIPAKPHSKVSCHMYACCCCCWCCCCYCYRCLLLLVLLSRVGRAGTSLELRGWAEISENSANFSSVNVVK